MFFSQNMTPVGFLLQIRLTHGTSVIVIAFILIVDRSAK